MLYFRSTSKLINKHSEVFGKSSYFHNRAAKTKGKKAATRKEMTSRYFTRRGVVFDDDTDDDDDNKCRIKCRKSFSSTSSEKRDDCDWASSNEMDPEKAIFLPSTSKMVFDDKNTASPQDDVETKSGYDVEDSCITESNPRNILRDILYTDSDDGDRELNKKENDAFIEELLNQPSSSQNVSFSMTSADSKNQGPSKESRSTTKSHDERKERFSALLDEFLKSRDSDVLVETSQSKTSSGNTSICDSHSTVKNSILDDFI